MIEHACSIVEDEAVDLTDADDHLQGMAEGVRGRYEGCYDETEGSPGKLCTQIALAESN